MADAGAVELLLHWQEQGRVKPRTMKHRSPEHRSPLKNIRSLARGSGHSRLPVVAAEAAAETGCIRHYIHQYPNVREAVPNFAAAAALLMSPKPGGLDPIPGFWL